MPAFSRFRKRVDYTEMGGAPLLGIDGAAIICHGSSPVKAIKNAVRVAGEWAKAGLNEHIFGYLRSVTLANLVRQQQQPKAGDVSVLQDHRQPSKTPSNAELLPS